MKIWFRFDGRANALVELADRERVRLRHDWLGTEHFVLALFADAGAAARLLGELGVTKEGFERTLVAVLGECTEKVGDEDGAALRALGIDVDLVRESVERTFGKGALDRQLACRGITPRARKALGRAAKAAKHLGDDRVRMDHVLLAILEDRECLATELLEALGAPRAVVVGRLAQELRRAS